LKFSYSIGYSINSAIGSYNSLYYGKRWTSCTSP